MPDLTSFVQIIPHILTPLGIFAFSIICCTGLLSYTAYKCSPHDKFAFKWVIHAFLGIFGAFVLTLLFCPSSVLSSKERLELAREKIPLNDMPWVVLIALFGGLIFYMVYQLLKELPLMKNSTIKLSESESSESASSTD